MFKSALLTWINVVVVILLICVKSLKLSLLPIKIKTKQNAYKYKIFPFFPTFNNRSNPCRCRPSSVFDARCVWRSRVTGGWCAAPPGVKTTPPATCSPAASTGRPSAGTSTSPPCCRRNDRRLDPKSVPRSRPAGFKQRRLYKMVFFVPDEWVNERGDHRRDDGGLILQSSRWRPDETRTTLKEGH